MAKADRRRDDKIKTSPCRCGTTTVRWSRKGIGIVRTCVHECELVALHEYDMVTTARGIPTFQGRGGAMTHKVLQAARQKGERCAVRRQRHMQREKLISKDGTQRRRR
jgi:hypothetical protein